MTIARGGNGPLIYGRTCVQRPPKGLKNSDILRQVVLKTGDSQWELHIWDPLNTGGLENRFNCICSNHKTSYCYMFQVLRVEHQRHQPSAVLMMTTGTPPQNINTNILVIGNSNLGLCKSRIWPPTGSGRYVETVILDCSYHRVVKFDHMW